MQKLVTSKTKKIPYRIHLNKPIHIRAILTLQCRSIALLLALIAIVLSNLSCSINPATGKPHIVTISEKREIKMGQEQHEKIIASTPIYKNEALNAYINEIGQRVAKNSDRPDLDYTFTILDSPDINAFAAPGGYIYIARGLLGYLKNEAQLAAVLAHEIAHVTARHTVRQKAAKTGANVAVAVSVLTTGSAAVADVANEWGTAAIMGYGREMELEADRYGAKYLVNSGYEASAMEDVIGVLKNQQTFSRRRAREEGKKARSYHGLFSTHPQNDKRLREVIAEAGKLPATSESILNEDKYREHINGVVFGVNYAAQLASQSGTLFTHSKLGFSILFPDGWSAQNTREAIIATSADNNAELRLEVRRLRDKILPDQYIRDKLEVGLLTNSEPISKVGVIGHTGIIPAKANELDKRLAVLYQANRLYIITGSIKEGRKDVNYDEQFLKSILSFKPGSVSRQQNNLKIRYVRANEKTSYAGLAQFVKLGKYSEQLLRLLNQDYPRGEPEPGEWVKIVE